MKTRKPKPEEQGKPEISAEQAAQLERATLKNIVEKIGAGGIPTAREMDMLKQATERRTATECEEVGALLNIRQLSRLTGRTRETIGHKLAHIPFKETSNRSKAFDSKVALDAIYYGTPAGGGGDGERITQAEATRRYTISRDEQVKLEMEVTRGDRWPKEDVENIHEQSLSNVAGLLKAHEGKTLTPELIRDIFTELREVPAKLTKL